MFNFIFYQFVFPLKKKKKIHVTMIPRHYAYIGGHFACFRPSLSCFLICIPISHHYFSGGEIDRGLFLDRGLVSKKIGRNKWISRKYSVLTSNFNLKLFFSSWAGLNKLWVSFSSIRSKIFFIQTWSGGFI